MPVAPAVDLLDPPSGGRVFSQQRKVRLGDVDRRGRLRLDATARLLQDVATDDASDAGLDRRFGWLVRRTLIDTREPVALGEPVEVSTWCAGTGRSWAERRTRIRGRRGGHVEGVSLWVQIDTATGRPARLASDFTDAYGETADGRTVSARLALPSSPSDSAERATSWTVRRCDLDPFGHVNNAANWAFLEEITALDDRGERTGVAEMEHVQPVTHDQRPEVMVDDSGSGMVAWLVQGETVLSAACWRPVSGG